MFMKTLGICLVLALMAFLAFEAYQHYIPHSVFQAYEDHKNRSEEDIVQRIRSNSHDEEALKAFESAMRSSDPSVRISFYGRAWEIMDGASEDLQMRLAPFLKAGLHDSEWQVRRGSATAIGDAVPGVVHSVHSDLISIVESCNEDNITHFAVEALGHMTDPDAINDAIPTLAKAASMHPEDGIVANDPGLRQAALKSLMQLSKHAEPGKIQEALKSIETVSKGDYQKMVGDDIDKLNKISPPSHKP